MAEMALDTHAFVKTLTAAGMPEAQAEAVTAVVRQSHENWIETLVTRSDLNSATAALKSDLTSVETRLRGEIGETEARLKLALAETKADIMKWMTGTLGGAAIINAMTIIGAMLALTRLGGH